MEENLERILAVLENVIAQVTMNRNYIEALQERANETDKWRGKNPHEWKQTYPSVNCFEIISSRTKLVFDSENHKVTIFKDDGVQWRDWRKAGTVEFVDLFKFLVEKVGG